MTRKVFLFAIMLLSTAVASQAQTKRYQVNVRDFTTLDVQSGLNVDYITNPDSAGMAVFYTTPELADNIIFTNNDKGRLLIQKAFHDDDKAPTGLPTITVYSNFLKEVKNSGDSTVRVLAIKPTVEFKAMLIGNGRLVVRDVECSRFEGSIRTGNGTLVATGNCDKATLKNTGTGSIQADNLKAGIVNTRFVGTGTTGCWPLDELSVKGIKGNLYYRGTPANIRNYSMGVKITSLEGMEWNGNKEKSESPEPKEDTEANEE